MKVTAFAGIGALAIAGAASAAFTGATAVNVGTDLEAGSGTTWQVFMNFDNAADQLVSISANAGIASLSFEGFANEDGTGGPGVLYNGALPPGLFDDTLNAFSTPADSYVTIGGNAATQNNSITPGLFGNDGISSVIVGSSLFSADGEAWFDQNPGTAETGGSIQAAQFSVGGFTLSGTVDYIAAGAGANSEAFSVSTVPAPGALALLGLAGLASRRRRA